MPELPEVQTIVDDLRSCIRDWTVADFSSLWNKNVSAGMRTFKKEIIGAKIKNVKRKGKYILLELDNSNVIVVHLRMTGALLMQVESEKLKVKSNKYIRHEWLLTKGQKKMKLLFSDVRKFATIDLLFGENRNGPRGLRELGVDPLNKKFTSELLEKIFHAHPKRKIRSILLDQDKISGIGNIYVSEILFDASISPLKEVGKLSKNEKGMLCESTKKILKKAIVSRGTTFSDYRDSRGNQGSFQNQLKVYNREHGRCSHKECPGVVLKEKIQGRSAFWCPKCQR